MPPIVTLITEQIGDRAAESHGRGAGDLFAELVERRP
jgi:hypothetical protein